MNSKELAQQLKSRFPANVVQFHTSGDTVEVRPTLKDEIKLTFSESTITLSTDDEELANFEADDKELISKVEKRVRKYILS